MLEILLAVTMLWNSPCLMYVMKVCSCDLGLSPCL